MESESNDVAAALLSSSIPWLFEIVTILVLLSLTVSALWIEKKSEGLTARLSDGLLCLLFVFGLGLAANNTYWAVGTALG